MSVAFRHTPTRFVLPVIAASVVFALPAQTVTEIPAPTVLMATINLDLLPTGPVTLGTLQAASPSLSNITFTPNTAAAGVYNTFALHQALCTVGGVMSIIDTSGTAAFDATDCRIDIASPVTEIGFGIGDQAGPFYLDFYLANSLLTTYSSFVQSGNRNYYQMNGNQFDRVDIRCSNTTSNWVITDVIDIPAPPNFGTSTPYGIGCGGGAPGFYEVFSAGFDLANSGVTMTNTGTRYLLTAGASPIVVPTGSGVVIGGDDYTHAVAVPFPVLYQDSFGSFRSTSTLSVCTNGWIYFGLTSYTGYNETVSALLARSLICPMWDDLNPQAAGSVYAEVDPVDPSIFHVTWQGVPEFPNNGSNNFQVTFYSNGDIEVKYGSCTVADCIVGLSTGGGISNDPGAIDISAVTTTLLGDGGPGLALTAVAGSRPIPGTSFDMLVANVGGIAPAFGIRVFSWTQNLTGIPLDPLGLIGCNQYFGTLIGGGAASVLGFPVATPPTQVLSFPIPNWATLAGVDIFAQVAVASLHAPGGFVASNGLQIHIDN